MSTFKHATIVFDLDGTLVDTAPDLLATVDRALATIDLAPAPHDAVRPLISYGSRAMLTRALEHHKVTLSEAELDGLWRYYLEDYIANISVHSRPFPGLVNVLETLEREGATLTVCTNKASAASQKLLSDLKLDRFFAHVAGRDTYPVRKPDPDHLRFAIRDAGGDILRSVMIGDSDVDVLTAQSAKVPVVGVTFGYTPAPVETFGPDAVIDHYDKL
ncbi:MAG: phosphoglycolate phosphatase, partial [Pseudomonadota bacterium]